MPFRLPIRLVLTAVSLAFALLHAGPLYGTGAALVVTVLAQLYLPGWLLARAFGKHDAAHPARRFTWVLAAGLGLVVGLGAIMRLLQLPVSVYVLALHGVMAGLALLPSSPSFPEVRVWRFERRNLPLYALLGVCCAAVLYAGHARSQIRFNNFADQTVFVSYADWLANNPESPHIHTRMAGTIAANSGDVRLLTDGWTYNHAAWVWTSGVPAAQLIWYDLTPLFVWTIPLVIFALAYELTGRETAAVWSAAALTVVGLMTLDSLVYRQNNLAFGQYGLLQLNTLRMMSRALMLPLALFVGLSYLRAPRLRDLALVFLAALAVAVMHPQQVVILLVSLAATTALWWLSQPTRLRFRRALALAATLAAVLILPYVQRASTPTSTRYTEEVFEAVETDADESRFSTPWYILPLDNLPLVKSTFIVKPSIIFYHPFVVAAAVLGLAAVRWWRRSLAAQYIVGSTAVTLLVLFTPGVTALFARLATLPALPGMVFGLPMALIFGLALDAATCSVLRWRRLRRGEPPVLPYSPRRLAAINASLSIPLIAVIGVLLFEPAPIPASARDQIRASNQLQSLRAMHVTDQQLLDSLTAHLPPDETSVLLTPNPAANYIIESVPGAIVTGGRRGHGNKWAFDGTLRFFGERAPLYGYTLAPWLDDIDLEFLNEFGVTHIVVEAGDIRLPQLLFQPERFELLDTPAGYLVFRVSPSIQPDAIDALYQQMNATYNEEGEQRWNLGAFELNRPANPVPWETFAETWAANLEWNPDDDRSRYGLAVTYTLMGRDEEALVLWRQLHERYPQAHAFVEAAAYTLRALERAEEAAQAFLAALDSPYPQVRVLAAKHLLTPAFFTHLEQAQIEQIVAVTQDSPNEWEQLVVRPALNEQRQRANLLMSVGLFDIADEWLAQIPDAEISPRDLAARASLALAQGDVQGALDVLRPATDPDEAAAARFLHPDRWEDNTAAQIYYLLIGGQAYLEGQWNAARAAYEEAAALGAEAAAAFFDGWTALRQQGDIFTDLETKCPGDEAQRGLVSPLVMARTGALYVMDMLTEQNEEAHQLTVCATYGNPTPSFGYNVRTWRIQVVSPDAAIHYGGVEVPSFFADSVLTRAAVTFTLPEDMPVLTPAHVYVEALYDSSLVLGRAVRDVVLNRPDAAIPPPDVVPANLHFGDTIILSSYTARHDDTTLDVTLYWEASAPPPEDYQVFVHVVDANNQPVAQGDSGPVDGRYPTSQWRTETLIEDRHTIPLDDLPAGQYQVRIGLYRLADGARLPITPADERVANDSALVYTFVR
jgi:tetratricopeptide (TPR) repeat protein